MFKAHFRELVKEKYCSGETDFPRVENRAKPHWNGKIPGLLFYKEDR